MAFECVEGTKKFIQTCQKIDIYFGMIVFEKGCKPRPMYFYDDRDNPGRFTHYQEDLDGCIACCEGRWEEFVLEHNRKTGMGHQK